ncbi:hypothetical protein T484DRAFT_1856216 [Baffinella frigidus]|nr:hypothetical protein T484DRAFT_1856216 [Cryptophyta sp. CCMP2293]
MALEAEVQQDPDNSDAWLTLGLAHAENDEDGKAIVALNRAVQADATWSDAADPTSLDALLALGVSHTNELEQATALTHLRTWITKHPEYAALCPRQAPETSETLHSTHALQREVQEIFTRVVQLRPDDAELHTVLGVLFNLSYEYGKAAIRVSPEDYTLWNKLGATLANSMRSDEAIDSYIQLGATLADSMRSDEAIDSYIQGLSIKPNYVRALANLAISYSNQAGH